MKKPIFFLLLFSLLLRPSAEAAQAIRSLTLSGTSSVVTGSTLTFNAGSTLTLSGTFGGTPTGGTLNLSALTLTLPAGVALPSQSGQGGKYLKTNGTTASWETVAGGGSYAFSGPLSESAGTVSIADAAADGATKGAASFAAADFNAASGVISIDYTNGQAASGSAKGFLTSADWSTFNGKLATNGNGSALTALNASQLASGTIPDARFPATLPALNGAALTALNASNLASGTLTPDRLASGTGLQVLRRNSGNNALEFATISVSGGDLLAANNLSDVADASTARTNLGLTIGTHVLAPNGNGGSLTALNASNLASGTVPDARFPATLPALNGSALTALNASNLASGTVPDARFPATLPALNGSALTALNADNLGSGTVPDARIASGITRDAEFDTVAERTALGLKSTTAGSPEELQAHGNTGATETFDLATANVHTATLDANCTFTLSGFTNGKYCSGLLGILQDATGSRTVTWPAAVVTAPTLNPAANSITFVSFWSWDGGTTIYAQGDYAAAAGDASTNTSSSVDAEVALFSGTGGKTLKRATGSGLAKLTSGVLSALTPGSGVETALAVDADASGGFTRKAYVDTAAAAVVSDTAYDATSWNGVAGVAASKNAVRDKIESLASDIAGKAPATSGTGMLKGNGSGGTATATAGTDYLTKATRLVAFSLTIDTIADGQKYTITRIPAAFTVTQLVCIHEGSGLSSPSVVATVKHDTDRSATGTTVEAVTATSSTTGTSVTSGIDDPTIPANSFLWVELGSKSGTTANLNVTVIGTYD